MQTQTGTQQLRFSLPLDTTIIDAAGRRWPAKLVGRRHPFPIAATVDPAGPVFEVSWAIAAAVRAGTLAEIRA